MQSFDSSLHNVDILYFILDVSEIKPVQVETPDTTENSLLPVCNGNEWTCSLWC